MTIRNLLVIFLTGALFIPFVALGTGQPNPLCAVTSLRPLTEGAYIDNNNNLMIDSVSNPTLTSFYKNMDNFSDRFINKLPPIQQKSILYYIQQAISMAIEKQEKKVEDECKDYDNTDFGLYDCPFYTDSQEFINRLYSAGLYFNAQLFKLGDEACTNMR